LAVDPPLPRWALTARKRPRSQACPHTSPGTTTNEQSSPRNAYPTARQATMNDCRLRGQSCGLRDRQELRVVMRTIISVVAVGLVCVAGCGSGGTGSVQSAAFGDPLTTQKCDRTYHNDAYGFALSPPDGSKGPGVAATGSKDSK